MSPRNCARRWMLALVLASVATATASAQPAATSNLSGTWTLQESTGNLPDQAVIAVDGVAASNEPVAIQIEQTDASVTVRRVGSDAALLRVMVAATAADHAAPPAGLLKAVAEWREGTLVARGDVVVKQGFLKRRVAFEERWRLDEEGSRLTVTTTLTTPRGARQRVQVFLRAPAEAAREGAPRTAYLFAHDVTRYSQYMNVHLSLPLSGLPDEEEKYT